MLNALVSFSLRFRGVVVTLACIVLAYGIYIAAHAKLDVFPSFVQPQVVIQTECPGLAPEQVEVLVTLPIEAMINGLGDMESLRSESIQGLSIVTAVFKEGTDVFRARQMLAETLAETAGRLPATVRTPRMTPLTSSTMDLLKIGLISDKLTPLELRTFADWILKPRLLSVPGVAKCSVFGGDVRQLQVQVAPDRLVAYGLSLSEVLAAARVSTAVLGAGFVETSNQRVTLQIESGTLTADDLAEVVIANTNGFSIRLKDVARVADAAAPKYGDCVIMGRPGILMTMSSQYGANTMEVTTALESALSEMKLVFEKEGITLYPALHRPATFIEVAVQNMKHSLMTGAILVAAVLFLLLGSVRSACISLVAIPLSLLTAVILLEKAGITINTITLGGLAIALGEVVDDSIIDVENIVRRLREFWVGFGNPPGLATASFAIVPTTQRVVLNASLEVRRAVVYATFIVALVFLPVLTMTGLQGSFFAPLAQSYLLAILASLLVALTVTPALSFLLFARGVRRTEEPSVQRILKAGYRRLLGLVMRWPRVVIAAVLLVCAAAATRIPFFGGEFLPDFREGHFVLQVSAAPGTSLPEMVRLGTLISLTLLADSNHIATVEQQVGRAELGEDPWGPHRSEFHVELKPMPAGEAGEMADEIRGILGQFPAIQFEVITFLADRIGETLTGETAPVVVNIFGDDLDVLDAKAREVAKVLGSVRGAADVQVKSPPGVPRVAVRLKPDRLTQFGFRPVEVLEAIQTAYQGTVVAQTHHGNKVADVSVILEETARRTPEGIGALMLSSASGVRLPLSELAEIESTSGRHSILHEGARRRQTLTCATAGRDVASFVADAKKEVAKRVNFPGNTYFVFSGAAEAKQKAQKELLLHSSVAAVGILLLLTIVFHRPRNLLLVLANVPFALVGGVLAVWLSGMLSSGHFSLASLFSLSREQAVANLSIGSLVGFVTLFGITMRNSIMLISHFEHLVAEESMTWGLDAAIRGASERLLPILMTATVTGLGLLPLALGAGEAGREIEGPMAVVILGGLATSTVLNLLVLPTLALKWGKFEPASHR